METKNTTTPEPGLLKRIDLESGKFTANGTNYTVEAGLSIERYCEFQILEKELAFGMTFKGIFDKLMEIKNLLDKVKFVAAITILVDLIRGVSQVGEREPVVLKMAALFINYEGENRAVWNTDLMNKKIADWKAEGLDMQDFFTVAFGSVNGFYAIYQNVTRNITEILDGTLKNDPI